MKTNKPITQGGKRANAGRKPIEDKKIPLMIVYVRQSKIDSLGGKEKAKEFINLILNPHIN